MGLQMALELKCKLLVINNLTRLFSAGKMSPVFNHLRINADSTLAACGKNKAFATKGTTLHEGDHPL
jgi:hypothetical protein